MAVNAAADRTIKRPLRAPVMACEPGNGNTIYCLRKKSTGFTLASILSLGKSGEICAVIDDRGLSVHAGSSLIEDF
jgi:hypothetical protein